MIKNQFQNAYKMNKSIRTYSKYNSSLFIPGYMPEELFWLLVELSPIHSERIIMGLKDFLVYGLERKDIYITRKISAGYFSNALGRLQRTSFIVSEISPYYVK